MAVYSAMVEEGIVRTPLPKKLREQRKQKRKRSRKSRREQRR
jgi:hypothetical protein